MYEQQDADLHLAFYSKIEVISDNELPKWHQNLKISPGVYIQESGYDYSRKKLNLFSNEYKENFNTNNEQPMMVEFKAVITQIDDRWLYYDGCHICGKKISLIDDNYGECPNHNKVKRKLK